ncbi:MAG: helix-turn-helix domain-containing protein [Candidatus Cloacimonetes bacterium]|nr:helix-turn-helix domain-containing protein [Candidatus Cloacimonadota bacterium]
MSEKQDRENQKATCERMYVEGNIKVKDLARVMGVSEKTIYSWIKKGKWDEKKKDIIDMEKKIQINLRKAIKKGLMEFANEPTRKDLQSLVGLIKQFRDEKKPTKEYKDYIIKFLDRTVDFLLENGDDYLTNGFKKKLVDLAQYLLKRN